MTVTPAHARVAVLTAVGLSLIVCALALVAHKQLYSKDLAQARAVEKRIRAQLDATDPRAQSRDGRGDALERALARQPVVLSGDASRRQDQAVAFYDAPERRAFMTARLKGALDSPDNYSLAPPTDLTASYASGGVNVSWDPGPVNRVLASTLSGSDGPLRLAFRVYRGIEGEQPELLATVPLGVTNWYDRALPIARTTLYYEVWTVLMASDATGTETLVSAERSDLVTLSTPEHFTLELLGGDEERAEFLAVVGSKEAPVASATVTASLGSPLVIGELRTGFVLQAIEMNNVETLMTRNRLVVTTDGGVVLDPTTRQPRTTQTQVLVPATRMTTTLVHDDGETRILEADLP